MEKFKRIAAIICLLIIVASYIATIVSVFLKQDNWADYLKASIFVTVVFPIILYGFFLIAKYFNKNN